MPVATIQIAPLSQVTNRMWVFNVSKVSVQYIIVLAQEGVLCA